MWNELLEVGLRATRPVRDDVVTQLYHQLRRHWCHAQTQWSDQQRRTFSFSDESRFMIHRFDWEQLCTDVLCIGDVERSDCGRAVMWANISHNGRTHLVQVNLTDRRYYDEILQQHIVPITNHADIIFQHSNARLPTSCVIAAFLRSLGLPSNLPDLKPMEYLCDDSLILNHIHY